MLINHHNYILQPFKHHIFCKSARILTLTTKHLLLLEADSISRIYIAVNRRLSRQTRCRAFVMCRSIDGVCQSVSFSCFCGGKVFQ